MKYLFAIYIVLICCAKGLGQEKHFIFIQSDNGQLYNVSLNGKLYSANPGGYVIIPKLTDGEYNMVIGFALNAFPDQGFRCIINKNDLGFELKNFGEKGWGLFNLQTLDMVMANDAISKTIATTPVKDEPISFNKKPDTIRVQPPVENVVSKIVDTIIREKPLQQVITKLTENKNDEGVTMLYSDANGAMTDTIQVIIPSAIEDANSIVKQPLNKQQAEDSAVAAKISMLNERKDEVKLLEIDMNPAAVNDSPKVSSTIITPPEKKTVAATELSLADPVKVSPMANDTAVIATLIQDSIVTNVSTQLVANTQINKSNSGLCNSVATEEDYARLRRNMALENSDDKMVREAKKIFKNKCFNTRQIKSLSTLFLSDEGRYHFFTASYSFVSDPATFSSLQSEFIDPYYISRFKSIVQ